MHPVSHPVSHPDPFCSGKNHKCPVPSGASHKQQKNGICDKAKEKAVVAKIGGYFQISGGVKNYSKPPHSTPPSPPHTPTHPGARSW